MNTAAYVEVETSFPPPDTGMTMMRAFQQGPLRIIVSVELHGVGNLVRHASVSCADRYPTWDEIKQVRRDFFEPHHHVAQMLPPEEQYVNLHPNCFHLWAKANGEPWA